MGRVRGKKDTVHIMPSIFKKEQADIFICRKNYPAPVIKKGKETTINPKWAEDSAMVVMKTCCGENALVLTGSFEEVNLLADNLTARGAGNVIAAEKIKSPYQKVREFKEKGGILIGTRNYGTGLDLPGRELTKLYITKLPFPVMNSKRFLDLREKDNNRGFFVSKREMILNLRQYIGRLIRTSLDKGEIYILDSRIWNPKYYHDVKRILEKYGIVKNKLI
jgi:Rad3-related DNA helicase